MSAMASTTTISWYREECLMMIIVIMWYAERCLTGYTATYSNFLTYSTGPA